MGVSTTAKRGDARSASRQSAHLKHEVIGVLLITLSLLILLSLGSFAPTDVPLFWSGHSPAASPAPTRNMIGAVGATLASALFWLVGGGAYLLPFLLAMLGVRCFVEGSLTVTLRSAAGSAASLLCLSGLLHLEVTAVPTLFSGLLYRGMAGGVTGQVLADGLRGYFASTGAHIIMLAGLLVSLLLATPMSLTALWRRVPGWWNPLTETVAAILPALSEWSAWLEPVRKTRPKPVKISRPVPVPPLPESSVDALAAEAMPAPVPAELPAKAADEPVASDEEAPEIVVTRAVSSGYELPDPQELLSDFSGPLERMTDEALKARSEVLTRALLSFGIEGKVTEVHPGPIVTMYEFEPAPGVKVARIVNLDNDLALALKATSLRIVAPLPGKSVVGIEVPNPYRETVSLKELVTSDAFIRSRSKLTIALGKDIFGVPVAADLKTMPHLLVAGATGAGKSVSLHTMLLSILFSTRPDEVKLLLIDPKRLEFQVYDGVPHLLQPVITDPRAAARGLSWVVLEMERRYKLLAEAGDRNIDSYNRRAPETQGAVKKSTRKPALEQPDLPMEFLSGDERLVAGDNGRSDPEAMPSPAASPMTPGVSVKTGPAPGVIGEAAGDGMASGSDLPLSPATRRSSPDRNSIGKSGCSSAGFLVDFLTVPCVSGARRLYESILRTPASANSLYRRSISSTTQLSPRAAALGSVMTG